MSYFDYKRIAKGYALDRPVYHIEFMEVVKQQLGLTESLKKGLDVGCGAGSSAIALGKLCKNVIGIDVSQEMILAAKQYCSDESMEFICCRAEDVNLEDDTMDIITAAGSMNWVNENIFLGKAHKLLKNQGYFIVYDNAMVNKMEDEPAFTQWWEEEYLRKFPKPARKEEVWADEVVESLGFHFEKQLQYPNKMAMTCEQLTAYLLTQTNVIAKVEEEGEDLEGARKWFASSLEPFFQGKIRELWCDGYLWFLKNRKETTLFEEPSWKTRMEGWHSGKKSCPFIQKH